MKKASKIKAKVVSPFLMWLIVLAGVIPMVMYLPRNELFSEIGIFVFVALLALIYWLYFFAGALNIHRQAPVSAAGIEKLVTEGVYGVVRHPMYMADIVLVWGLFLLFPQIRFLVAALWLTIVLVFWMVLEERALEEKFGQGYRTYKQKVPMIFPRFKKRK